VYANANVEMEGYYPSTEAAVVVEVSVSPACM
jgi:hypothetical protein